MLSKKSKSYGIKKIKPNMSRNSSILSKDFGQSDDVDLVVESDSDSNRPIDDVSQNKEILDTSK